MARGRTTWNRSPGGTATSSGQGPPTSAHGTVSGALGASGPHSVVSTPQPHRSPDHERASRWHERPAHGTRRLRQLGRGGVGAPDLGQPVPSSGAVRIMAGPDAHGAQSAEQDHPVDSLHPPPFPAPHGARQGGPGPVHRVIPGGGRHDRPATDRPTGVDPSLPRTGEGPLPPPRPLPPPPSEPPPPGCDSTPRVRQHPPREETFTHHPLTY